MQRLALLTARTDCRQQGLLKQGMSLQTEYPEVTRELYGKIIVPSEFYSRRQHSDVTSSYPAISNVMSSLASILPLPFPLLLAHKVLVGKVECWWEFLSRSGGTAGPSHN